MHVITKMASIIEPTRLLFQIIESEESVWLSRRTNLEGSESADGRIDEIIKHGRLLPVIHKFFFKLEKQQVCLNLSSLATQSEFVRVNPDSPNNANMFQTEHSEETQAASIQLQREDLAVYRCALMCAQFPVLSAPSPPENDSLSPQLHSVSFSFSPSEVPTDIKTNKDKRDQPATDGSMSYSALIPNGGVKAEVSSSLPTTMVEEGASIGPSVDKFSDSLQNSYPSDGTDIVSRELLRELVRKAFSQSTDQQLRYEQVLRQDFGRRSKGEILVKELVSQLKILENNAHPFYKPKLFLAKSGYDVWLQREKRRIKQLIEKFWHYSLPPPSTWIQYNPVDYHKAYSILLDKLLHINNGSGMCMPESQLMNIRVISGSILSAAAQRLLQEFGLRFGVGELYCRILYLDRLAKAFDYQIEYLQHMKKAMVDVKNLIPHSKTKITMVKQESDILRGSLRLIRAHCEYSFTRIERLFRESSPPSGIVALIELYQEVFDMERGILGKHPEPLDKALKKFLKSGFLNQYERQKMLAEHSAQESLTYPHRLSPLLVYSLIVGVKDVMDVYSKFQDVFVKYVNLDIMALGRMELYTLLNQDAHRLIKHMVSQRESREAISSSLLALLYRLDGIDQHWRRYVLPDMQSWRKPFTDLVLIWMEVLVKQLNQWVLSSLGTDQWKILRIHQEPAELDSYENRKRSSSAVSLVPSEYSAFADISGINQSRAPSSISSLSSTGNDGLTSKSKTHLMSASLPSSSPFLIPKLREVRTGGHRLNASGPFEKIEAKSDSYLDKRRWDGKTSAFSYRVSETAQVRDINPVLRGSPALRHLHENLEDSLTPVCTDSEPVTPVPAMLRSTTPVQDLNDLLGDGIQDGQINRDSDLFLPVSNSAFDLVVMHRRLANFVACLQNTVAPKLGLHTGLRNEFSPDLSLSGEGIFYQNGWIEATRQNLRRKLHKAIVSSTKLYVDNLICMDLCGLTTNEALVLLGQETFFYLKNRKDANEVWGCRHEVDRIAGQVMESPCPGKFSDDYENTTVGMCIRMNNVHFVLKLFPYLEKHLHNITERYPEGLTEENPLLQSESENRGGYGRDVGFFSKESLSLIDHIKRSQSTQVHLLCSRLNKFIEGALSVLLELVLPGYSVEQRLQPLFTFLQNQKEKFVQYLFPECCQGVLRTLWSYIVKDLEAKALLLKSSNNEFMVVRSRFLIQVTRQMVKFFYNEGKGVDVGYLVSTSDFLLTVLSYYEKPTSRLGDIYLSLQEARVDLVVPLSSEFLSTLKGQLQSLNKSFSGKEFIMQFSRLLNDPTENFPELESVPSWNHTTNQEEIAANVGQMLLKQGILVQVDGVVVRDSRAEMMSAALTVANSFDSGGLYHFSSSEDFEGYQISIQHIPFCKSIFLNQPRDAPNPGTERSSHERARVQTLLFLRNLLLLKCTSSAEKVQYRVHEQLDVQDEVVNSNYNCLFKL